MGGTPGEQDVRLRPVGTDHHHALITEAGVGGREGQLDLPSEPRRGPLVEDDEVRQRQIDERFGVENRRLARKCERRDNLRRPRLWKRRAPRLSSFTGRGYEIPSSLHRPDRAGHRHGVEGRG
jgi:hypothetical protein